MLIPITYISKCIKNYQIAADLQSSPPVSGSGSGSCSGRMIGTDFFIDKSDCEDLADLERLVGTGSASGFVTPFAAVVVATVAAAATTSSAAAFN